MDKPFVSLEKTDKIARITFFHPKRNALPMALLNQLEGKLNEAGKDEDIAIILLQSGGDNSFCAGANFDELLAIKTEEQGKVFFSGFGRVINAIRKNEKLVIGRIHGKAVGGGVGLAAACDLSFATEDASVRLSEVSIGIGPFVIAPAIIRKMGIPAFSNMSLQPTRWVPAMEALSNGLFAGVFSSTQALDQHLATYLTEMTSYSQAALQEMKRILWTGTDDWDKLLEVRAIMSGKLVLSNFTKNALSQFKKK